MCLFQQLSIVLQKGNVVAIEGTFDIRQYTIVVTVLLSLIITSGYRNLT